MNEMIERVARAICKARGFEPEGCNDPAPVPRGTTVVLAVALPNWRYFRVDAEAAIAAMREPTEVMLCEGLRQPCADIEEYDLKVAWQAMIDEVLRE